MRFSALHVFKTPEVTSAVKFLNSEAGANGFSTELLQTAAKTFQKGLRVYLKRPSLWMFYSIRNFERQNFKLQMAKKNFCNADADADCNTDADDFQMVQENYSKLFWYKNSGTEN